jgi:hypothetical protein
MATKSGTCDCCGQRTLRRVLTEVLEEDQLLSWYPGERLCSDCIRAGYWAERAGFNVHNGRHGGGRDNVGGGDVRLVGGVGGTDER